MRWDQLLVSNFPLPGLRGFPILVTHGTDDRQIPIRSARDIRQALKPLSVDLEYHEFESGHWVSDQAASVLDR